MKMLAKRRRLENKTNYLRRKRLLESKKPRIVIRKTNKYILIQYVESKSAQDNIKFSVLSKELLDYGWPKEKEGSLKSLPAAYLSGLLFGKKIKGLKEAVLDMGLIRNTKGSRIYASVKGIIDSGFNMNCSKEVFPEENRIKNDNSKDFFDKVKSSIGEKK